MRTPAIRIQSISLDGMGIQPDPFREVLPFGALDGDSPPIFCRGLLSFLGIDLLVTVDTEFEVVAVSLTTHFFVVTDVLRAPGSQGHAGA